MRPEQTQSIHGESGSCFRIRASRSSIPLHTGLFSLQFGNPQLSRIASRVQSQQQAELLTMLQLLLPGTNSIYYGEEIGMLDLPFNKSVIASLIY